MTQSYDKASIDYDDFFSCPEDYQKNVVRIISMQAYAEMKGATEVGYQLKLAPDAISRKRLAKIVYDEASHAYLLYDILHQLNVSEEEAIGIAEGKNTRSSQSLSLDGVIAVGDDENTWLDIVLNNFFLDRAGSFMVNNFAKSSFKPWSKACESIYKDEVWHVRFGLEELTNYIETHSLSCVAEKFGMWYARALNFFGPSFSRSHEQLKAYGIKRLSNHELRQQFITDVTTLIDDKNWHDLLPCVSQDYPFHINHLEALL